MIYENNNVKAIVFGEGHIRRLTGHIGILVGKYEDKVANGWNLGGLAKRHRGMTVAERRQAILNEDLQEIEDQKQELRLTIKDVEDLKDLLEKRDNYSEDFFLLMARQLREEITRLTGSNKNSFMEDD